MAEAAPEVPLPLFPLDQPFVDRHPPPPLIAVDDAYLKALERYVDILPRWAGEFPSPDEFTLAQRNAQTYLTIMRTHLGQRYKNPAVNPPNDVAALVVAFQAMTQELAEFRAEMRAEMGNLRVDLRAEIGNLRVDLTNQMVELDVRRQREPIFLANAKPGVDNPYLLFPVLSTGHPYPNPKPFAFEEEVLRLDEATCDIVLANYSLPVNCSASAFAKRRAILDFFKGVPHE